MNNAGKIIYKAVAEEKFDGEVKQYKYEESKIDKGEYMYETVKDWRSKTNSLKDVFSRMIKDDRVDKTSPAVEWYKTDNEMWCMIKTI